MRTKEQCARCADKTALVLMAGNTFLCAFKLTVGVLSGSLAVIADGIHSGADVMNAMVTAFSVRIGRKPPDKGHPYGHGKTEFISGSFVGLVLLVGAASILVNAVGHILSRSADQKPHIMAVAAALVSIAVNELMCRYARCAAARTNSTGLAALAWDNRADTISSTPVLFGVIGAQLGLTMLDPLAAFLVGILVGKIGWEILAKNIGGLMDTPLRQEEMRQIRKVALAVPGVNAIGNLKARSMGRDYFVDMEILVDAQTTVEKSNSIASRVRGALRRKMSHLGDITICCRSKGRRRKTTA